MTCEVFPLKEHCLMFRAGRYLAATCNILQELRPFVNSYLELFSRFFNCSRCCPWIRKKHRLRDAHLHMAGVAGLEPTHAGFRDPCLTNLAIPLCLSTFIYYTDEGRCCQQENKKFLPTFSHEMLALSGQSVIMKSTNESLFICLIQADWSGEDEP